MNQPGQPQHPPQQTTGAASASPYGFAGDGPGLPKGATAES